MEIKQTIKYEYFSKIDIRVGTVIKCEKVEKSDKLLKLEVDFGDIGKRQILTGLAKWYEPEDFLNKQFPFIVNMETRKMMGLESQGMILGIGTKMDEPPTFLLPSKEIKNGEGVC